MPGLFRPSSLLPVIGARGDVSVAATFGDLTLAGAAMPIVGASLAAPAGDLMLAGAAMPVVGAAVAATVVGLMLAGAAMPIVGASLAAPAGDLMLAAAAMPVVGAVVAATLGGLMLAGAAMPIVGAVVAATLGGLTLAAFARVPAAILRWLLVAPRLLYVAIAAPDAGGPVVPPARSLPDIGLNQIPMITVDFGIQLPPGVTLTGTPVVTLSSAGDAAAPARVSVGPMIGTAAPADGGTGIANTAIFFQFTPAVAAFYVVDAYCMGSDGNRYELSTRFSVVPPS